MIVSMTGFDSQVFRHTLPNNDVLTMTVSVKSLNSRFFELSAKLPFAFSNYELEIQKLLKQHLIRGHVYVTIYVLDQSVLKNKVSASLPIAQGYLNELQRIQQALGIPGQITINDIARIPHVFTLEESELDESVKHLVIDAINQVTQGVIRLRTTEGDGLKKDILGRLTAMRELRDSIEARFKVVFAAKQLELHDKLAALLSGASAELADAQRAAVLTTIERLDVHEELVRLDTHFINMLELINAPKIEKGRQLDFMIQELSREANTIASKSIDTTITQQAVLLKVEIEKIREQMQNIL